MPLRLSAVIPNFNHARYLPHAIESVLRQTRLPDEFLILDDASTDNSAEIIESYAAKYPLIRFLRNSKNQGVISAHEQLFNQATGDWLYSGAADDDRYPDFFRSAMDMAEKFPDAGIVFGKMVTTDAEGHEIGEVSPSRWQNPLFARPEQFLTEYLNVESPFHSATAATLFRRDAFAEVGWFRGDLGSFSDTFATRAIALKYGACYVPERFCTWRKITGSVSQEFRQDVERTMQMVDRAASLMMSPAFQDRFPAAYVEHWKQRARMQLLWSFWLGDEYGQRGKRPPFLLRNLSRLRRLPALLRLAIRTRR